MCLGNFKVRQGSRIVLDKSLKCNHKYRVVSCLKAVHQIRCQYVRVRDQTKEAVLSAYTA